jgi:uncharacterized protein YbgA (DUF1722 family)
MLTINAQDLRFKFYHDLDSLYHRFFDEIAQSELSEREAASLAQTILRSRQDSLKYFISMEEMKEYLERYPEERG